MAIQLCTLTYTILTESEAYRASLEDALGIDGWKKTGNEQQTHWTGKFPESRFFTTESGEKKWAPQSIKRMFLAYFSSIKSGEHANVSFVIQVGNFDWKAITVVGTKAGLLASINSIDHL